MKKYDLIISYPAIRGAGPDEHKMLVAVYNCTMTRILLSRFGLTGRVVSKEKQPIFIVSDVMEQDIEKIERNVVHQFNQLIDSSHKLKPYISSHDVNVQKKDNFEDVIKRLPELEGIF
jgi:hypothetical protein